jgi:hypothetical protein
MSGIISLCIVVSCLQTQANGQTRQDVYPLIDGSGFMHITANVGNGVTITHDVLDLFLTDTSPPRASYLLSITTKTLSGHSVDVVSRDVVVPCAIEYPWPETNDVRSQRFCTLNRYQSVSIYMIVLFDL